MPQISEKTPDEADIRAALARVTSSEGFARSQRMSSLLDYLVNQTLAGESGKIKATSIAIDLLGRDETFDQQSDPIVRVEAGRLRNRLQEYYRGSGSNDPLLIEIPKGAYVPRFSFRPTEEAEANTSTGVAATASNRNHIIGAFIAGLVVAVLVTSITTLIYQGRKSAQKPGVPTVQATDTRPYIVINPVAASAGDTQSELLAAGLVEALITNLSKISGLSVMAHASVLESHQRGEPFSIADFRNQFGVTHLLRGTIEGSGERVIVNMQLVDARTARVLWAERASRSIDNIIDLEEELALTIAQQLAVQLQPGERDRLSQYHAASSEAWLFYRQGLITIMPPRDLVRVEAARKLFDRATQVDSNFAGGHAGHSFAHSTRVLFMNTTDPAWELANAKAMAQKAIDLDPEFGPGYAMMAFAQILAGEREAAIANANQSVLIQPGDAFARFIVGMSLIISEEPEQSIPHFQEALRLDPLESRMPYLNLLGIAYYAAGDYSNAVALIEQNYRRGGPRGPHMELFRIASYAQLEDREKAMDLANTFKSTDSAFPVTKWMNRWLLDEQQQAHTLKLLKDSGLDL